jgi:hypothetical protein
MAADARLELRVDALLRAACEVELLTSSSGPELLWNAAAATRLNEIACGAVQSSQLRSCLAAV